ncbi:hypothetical protein B9Z55_024931 [Caenorhabditis nigoni]|uniref:Uncharacterized protein n=1 Tax=Caenorhabditis nigoni TaxID=1611254 RepID=A0A2G5SWE7_9PELO|nr:hypothetical protein B9Z55_024931 [Caenorhabditis nigoni]
MISDLVNFQQIYLSSCRKYHKRLSETSSSKRNAHNPRDDILAYLNNPDRCPKYIEKEPTVTTSQPAFTPRRVSIPTAFLKQG